MGAELEKQTQTTLDTQPTNVLTTETKEETAKTDVPNTPSVEEVLSALAATGNETLMQLAPVKELIEAARKQEKDKLYKSIEQKNKEAKEFADKLAVATESLKKYETDNLSFEEKMQQELQRVKEEHEKLVRSIEAEKEQAVKEAKEKALAAYKAEKLRLAGDELILGLVGGNSEEEIDQSIENAKAEYQKIANKFAVDAKEQKVRDTMSTFTATAPSSSSLQPLTREDINRMSPEEYAKNRPRILEAMRLGIID